MQEADDPERGTGEKAPDNTSQAYRDAAQPVKPAFDEVDEYGGVGVTQDKPVDDLSDKATDDAGDQADLSVRLLVVGGGVLKIFHVVAVIGPDWIDEHLVNTAILGNLDDMNIDDPPGPGLWVFNGKAVDRGDADEASIIYEGEYTRPGFHEVMAFGLEWGPVPEGAAPPLPVLDAGLVLDHTEGAGS